MARGGTGDVRRGQDTLSGRDIASTRLGIGTAGHVMVGVRRGHLVTVQRLDAPPSSRAVMGDDDVTFRMRRGRHVHITG